MGRREAWVLNLDAELELAAFADGHDYERSGRMAAEIDRRTPVLVERLRRARGCEITVLSPGRRSPADAASWEGCSWCPTPSALALIATHGCAVPEAPSLDVLQRANHRAFAWSLTTEEDRLPGARYVTSREALEEVVRRPTAANGWLLKRAFGFAGRWRKRVDAGVPLSGADRVWAEASLRDYGRGLVVEPWVEIELEVSMHGAVERSAIPALRRSRPVVQHCDANGSWLGATPVEPGQLGPDEAARLLARFELAGHELHSIGYFGPFNVDAFRWRLPASGGTGFAVLTDLNARWSMGRGAVDDPRTTS